MKVVYVLLLKFVSNLGKPGDMVYVARGFFTNYLKKKGYAVLCSTSGKIEADEILKQKEEQNKKEIENSKEIANRLSGCSIKFKAESTDRGRMFGSIPLSLITQETNSYISNLGYGQTKLSSRDIVLKGGINKIRDIGDYCIKVTLPHGIFCDIAISVERI